MSGAESKHILIIVENLPVPFDRRVWLESITLHEAGYDVSVICPQGSIWPAPYEVIDGIHIYRYPPPPPTTTKIAYAWEFPYCWAETLKLAWRIWRKKPFQAIHACNPPDTFFLIGRIFGALGRVKFVYDQHDLCPELYLSRFGGTRSVYYGLLRALERATYRSADMVISTNESYRRQALSRGRVAADRVFVVRSGPRASRFTPTPPDESLKRGKKHLVCYLGVMAPQDGVDYLLRAARHVVDVVKRKDVHFTLIGSGDSFQAVKALRDDLSLTDAVEMTGRDLRRGRETAPVDGGRVRLSRPEEPAQRRLDDEQGPRVHDVRQGDGLLRPQGEQVLGRGRRPVRDAERRDRVRGEDHPAPRRR